MRRESPIKRRNPSGRGRLGREIHRPRRQAPHRQADAGIVAREPSPASAKPSGRSTRPTGSRTAPTPWASTSPPGPSDHPRSERTNETNEHRISRVARRRGRGHPAEGLADARAAPPPRPRPGRPHAARPKVEPPPASSASSARSRRWPRTRSPTKSATSTPSRAVRIRANDPRAKKKRRPIRVFSFEEMHASPRPPAATRQWSASSPTPA